MRSAHWLIALALAAGCGGASTAPPSSPPPAPPPPPPPPAAVPAALAVHAGNQQQAVPGQPVPIRPAVRVTDASGRPVPGTSVTFSVDSGGGTIEGAAAVTDADGVAAVGKWTMGRLEGTNRLVAVSGTLSPAAVVASARFERGTFLTSDLQVTVTLPAGSGLAMADLEAANTFGHVPLAADGRFGLPFSQAGPQLAVIQTPNREPVLMGWIDATHLVINARTTAEVLAFFDGGAFRLPNAKALLRARGLIEQLTTELAPLEQAIGTALRAGPNDATLVTPALQAARTAYRRALETAAAQSTISRSTKIEPNAVQSGLAVDDTAYQQIRIANWHRRRSVAFLDRVSYVPAAGGAPVPSASPGQPIKVGSANGLQNAGGGLVDAFTGNEAWEPAIVSPIPTPLSPINARATIYRMTIVGSGYKEASKWAELSQEQREAADRIAFENFMMEMLIPAVSTVVSGLNEAGKAFGSPEFLESLDGFFDVLPADIIDKAINGDLVGGTVAAFKLLVQNGDVQQAFLDLIWKGMARQGISNPGALVQLNDRLLRALTVLDVILGTSDLVLTAAHSDLANRVETWDVRVNASKVKIKEGSVKLGLGDGQNFHALVLDASGGAGEVQFRYRWTTTGTVGKLTAPGVSSTTTFEGTSDVVAYTSDLSGYGIDRVILEAFQIVDGKPVTIGADTVTAEVVPGQILLVPEKVSLKNGESHNFEARVEDARLIGGVLSYRWGTTGKFGNLAGGTQGAETSTNTNKYTARSTAEGSDVISVEVYSTRNQVRTLLGKAKATVLVEKKKTVFFGSWTTTTTSWPEGQGNRICLSVVVDVPLVEGATEYVVRGYGFNDPLYYHRKLGTTVRPPFTDFIPCGVATGFGRAGRFGGTYRWPITQGTGNVNPPIPAEAAARFAGMVIEVTVKY